VRSRVPVGAVLAIGAVALALRLGFVAWAPDGLVGDARAYDQQARILLAGRGYVHLDGSPAVRWMPGWPATIAGLYRLFGAEPRVAMYANALFGAGTAALVAVLGSLLLGRRAGIAAGILHALWPGVVYFSAVLMTESLFTFLVVLAFALVAAAGRAGARRPLGWLAASGLAFGLAAWVRAEAVVLPLLATLHLRAVTPGWRVFAGRAALLVLVSVAVLAPWSLRNYAAFGRVVPTSGNGGIVFWIANHRGASGTNDPLAAKRLHRRFEHLPLGPSTLARSDAGFREAWRDIREDPGGAGRRVVHKLVRTYDNDASATALIRGFEGALPVRPSPTVPAAGFISHRAQLRLARLANAWWAGVLGLAALGLTFPRVWSSSALWLVLGPLGFWVLLQCVMLGGARFHFPQTPFLALLAGCGTLRLAAIGRRARRRVARRRMHQGSGSPSAA
jgi:4-amino-4-deoxy-L-arabinose transferase-like glycosyltransferase